ncbi:DUF1449 domain-containing protein [Marinagarivorans cellulosilyticus]|uniref:DUF1449 domain-containing protein n=1 Tax=Marinagarivorans cellulosilyticus TaxID=2721545 RepID=A0AAN1WIF6_9GAMM|nr:DUF1449 domain-containing protein [Marinagarivorans cellulosilyticus]BCD98159.1 hypothetical protein MARGE09_P2360 [Marinagarivorans cellulosilyticus]
MFAILFSEGMTPFYQNVSSFPTVFFSFFLIVSCLFWAISIMGMIDIEILDLPEAETGGEEGMVNGVSTVLLKLGLNGVPITIIITLIALFGWFVSFYSVYFFQISDLMAPIRWVANVAIFAASLYVAILITSQVIKPLRSLFKSMSNDIQKKILGQAAVVRTSRVDEKFGEAEFNDGGAGLILKVRSFDGAVFKRNDRVILLEYVAEQNFYKVIAESEFSLGGAAQ